ncbi:MAG TPA: phosphodiester glycosidase family protein [Gaiellaceae bacterium]|nr:phosphodiester glycosidase family protein [Gaiellaceae bacterium]
MIRRSLTIVLAAATLSAPAAAAPIRGQTLMPGVVYSRQLEFTLHGPVVLNVAQTPRPTGLYGVHALLSNGAVAGTQQLTQMEKSISAGTTVVGVDGDLFNTRWGTPSNILMRGGVLATATSGTRSAAGFDAGGTLHVDKVALSGTWKGTGQNRPLSLNQPPPKGASTTLYTPAWGATTPGETGVTELILSPFPAAVPNTALNAPAVQVAQTGSQPIPPNGAVLVSRGTQAKILATEAPVGTTVTIRLILTPPWSTIVDAVGGGPVLVRNGKTVFRSNETFSTAQLLQRTARAAVGQTSDGRLLLVSVDGGRPGYSNGMTSFELALAMRELGAVNACALGTGAAASLAFDGKLLSRPSGNVEAGIADALVVTYDGVYAPQLPTTTLPTGKAVALAYKVVRPSTVTATVTAPNGTTTTIDSGSRAPGTYTLSFTPNAGGHWTFNVAATDDLGRSTSASRTFTTGP